MKPGIVLTFGVVVGAATVARAQSSNCPGSQAGAAALITQDACQKAVDLFQYMAPQLGGAITGGNATIGQSGALGGLGHFSVGVRLNAIQGSVPKVNDPAVAPVATGARASAYNTSDFPLPMPTADGALGLFGGIPFGLTNIGAVDALVSLSYVPNVTENGVTVEPDNPVRFGYGARIGIIQESIVTPGVAVTYLRRDLPTVAMTATASNATLHVTDFDIQTSAWRVVASKSLVLFGIAVGIGQDKYNSVATASATAGTTAVSFTSSPINVSQEMSRTNLFGDLSFNLPFVKIVLEGGEITSGAQPTTLNTFVGKQIVDPRFYGSLGLRLAW